MKYNRLSDMEHYITKNGTAALDELSRHFHVSMSTIHRDIAELTRNKGFRKVYGGIVHEGQALQPKTCAIDSIPNDGSEPRIGTLAASLIHDGMSIFLDSSKMAKEILPHIAAKRDITVVTHHLATLAEASKYASLNVIALGGIYSSETESFSGKTTLDELSNMSIDLVFFTADGVSREHGLTCSDYMDARIKRTIAQRNHSLVLLLAHASLGKSALITFCELDELHTIISEEPISTEYFTRNELVEIRFLTPSENKR